MAVEGEVFHQPVQSVVTTQQKNFVPPTPPVENSNHPLTEQNTLFQRYQFVESQVKNKVRIADIHANLDQFRQDQDDHKIHVYRACATSTRKLLFSKIQMRIV